MSLYGSPNSQVILVDARRKRLFISVQHNQSKLIRRDSPLQRQDSARKGRRNRANVRVEDMVCHRY